MSRAAPIPDEDSAPFWQGLRNHEVLLQKCANCSEVRFPPMPGCPNCGSPKSDQITSDGTGSLYSWIVVHRPLGTISEAELPLTIATVELAEGCRLLGHLHGVETPSADLRVKPLFLDHEDWTELAFRPDVAP